MPTVDRQPSERVEIGKSEYEEKVSERIMVNACRELGRKNLLVSFVFFRGCCRMGRTRRRIERRRAVPSVSMWHRSGKREGLEGLEGERRKRNGLLAKESFDWAVPESGGQRIEM
jgi:GH24 family phage-related lysozyme (muramidase)